MTAKVSHWRKPPLIKTPALRYGIYAVALTYFVLTIATLPIDWERTAKGMEAAGRIFSGAFPPALSVPACCSAASWKASRSPFSPPRAA
ncbi:hypothetical protein PSC71_00325 [Devosia sp. J2-20]|uniref:hypothetical protein n=1 Tax=Devosia sp. J2-20 TaxID=3026161 RepID=UPI00249A9AD3|nr:hypothetical protein [Devosia sp. J2-20]WDQ99294.1 hypothetical protein PSC71_00325 [Devosia sp. J2-20]